MTDTPTVYSQQRQYHYGHVAHICERCRTPAVNFTELYNPRDKTSRTVYLCDACQTKLCAQADLFIRGDYQ